MTSTSRPKERRWRTLDLVLAALPFMAAAAAWQVAVSSLDPPRYILPAPALVLQALVENWMTLIEALVATSLAALTGLGLSVVLGSAIGLCVGMSEFARSALMGPILATQSVPKVALAPAFVAWFGFGMLPKVVIVVLVTIFPIIVGTAVGAASTPNGLTYLARSAGAGLWSRLNAIVIPQSAPHMVGGIRVAASLALIGAIVAEYVGAERGLGVVLRGAAGMQDTPLVVAAIIVSAVGGLVIYLVTVRLTSGATARLGPYHMQESTQMVGARG